jgi:hypothetical protein
VLEPRIFTVTLNGNTISSAELPFGVNKFEGQFDTDFGHDYTVALSTVGEVDKPVAIINNIEVVWPLSTMIRPGGTILAQFEETRSNEIWNYFDHNSTQKDLKFANSPSLRTISLDYQGDESYPGPGFINNFGVFVGDDGIVDDLRNNDHKPYIISRAGEFQFSFRAPLAPWLLKRLFFQPRTV